MRGAGAQIVGLGGRGGDEGVSGVVDGKVEARPAPSQKLESVNEPRPQFLVSIALTSSQAPLEARCSPVDLLVLVGPRPALNSSLFPGRHVDEVVKVLGGVFAAERARVDERGRVAPLRNDLRQ